MSGAKVHNDSKPKQLHVFKSEGHDQLKHIAGMLAPANQPAKN